MHLQMFYFKPFDSIVCRHFLIDVKQSLLLYASDLLGLEHYISVCIRFALVCYKFILFMP